MSCPNTLWKNASRVGRYLRTIGIGLVLASALPGCFAHARGELVYDQPVEYVDTVPDRIEYYPRTDYQGQPAYLVDGRWYYSHNRRWVVFRDEPVELRQYRTRHVPAYAAGPRYETRSKSLSPRRADERRIEERRDRERRADARRREERRAEQRHSEERRDRERRAEARRAESDRAEVRRMEDRKEERRAYSERRVAERKARPQRKVERDPRDRKDERTARERRDRD